MTAPARFTGDAHPYTGGDPYADYRTADFPFTRYADLADRRLGATVMAAADEFFAARENLLLPGPARFDPDTFGPKGKIMDGWETRRRRGVSAEHPWPAEDDHDWALIRLGAPGVVHGVVVDTAHFRGNHPQAVRVEGTCVDGAPSPKDLLADDVTWTTLVPRTPVGGHAANGFAVDVQQRVTHVRLTQYPDGGIARLRVHGEVVPDPAWLAVLGTFDLVALENGGVVEDASDVFYAPAVHTILPGRSRTMDEGWETRRRRDRGHDWIRYRLAAQSEIRAVCIDTACLRGNSAGWASVSVKDGADGAWREILPPTRLQPDTDHRFVLPSPAVATHARLDVLPDGGISRLRLYGSPTEAGAARLAARHRESSG
ncbi:MULTISPECIES: allantoicase [Streptomyces]|uniref:Probable allantoicase n=1 Tax=Streptomyces thermoviolaceus subsp. thermoviolaceus TaxID=66860 RepID=A0ABX0YWE4_STRTL|nr:MULTISPECIES: allantoicase [Streptomyces]MCM3266864.1 allantoicase [Streptomyces thermoviolaceus]NJP16960.1 allantoicase [Streptomyces thermoviolaceus subsp. thermoviolaceus]RSS09124.1 allantoicase [Streptomyces sp. WAC00469]WTD46817.1 allantoicase [Streptomyces thermoviolaceus]GGV72199.1 putative allantoicase [Streptomyces thermoviolaceus subsp. apingens]